MVAASYTPSEQNPPAKGTIQWLAGAKLKAARGRIGLSQAAFGFQLGGAAESSVRAWENGKRVPRWDKEKRRKVAEILEIPVEEVNNWFEPVNLGQG